MTQDRLFVGLDVGGTSMKGGVIDDAGQALSAVSLPTMITARVEGAYAFSLPAGQLALGVDLGYARLPYTRQATSSHPALQGTSGGSGCAKGSRVVSRSAGPTTTESSVK